MGRALAIDYGQRRIGLALSDPTKLIASALTTLIAEKKLEETAKKLLAAVAEHDIDTIVLGLPYRMTGKVGVQADEVKQFAAELEKKTEIPIILWDERLTSLQANRAMQEAGMSRKKRAKVVDSLAAILILQSYLDSQGENPLPA